MFRQITAISVQRYISSVSFKTEQGNKRVREKSDIKFLFWKDWD